MITGCTDAMRLPMLTSECKQHECCLKYLKLDFDVTKNVEKGAKCSLTTNPSFVCNIYKAVCTQNRTTVGIADFIGLPYFSGFPSGLKSHVLISNDFFSQPKFVPLPRDLVVMCSRPASKHQKKFCFVSKRACLYCIRSED